MDEDIKEVLQSILQRIESLDDLIRSIRSDRSTQDQSDLIDQKASLQDFYDDLEKYGIDYDDLDKVSVERSGIYYARNRARIRDKAAYLIKIVRSHKKDSRGSARCVPDCEERDGDTEAVVEQYRELKQADIDLVLEKFPEIAKMISQNRGYILPQVMRLIVKAAKNIER